VEGRGQGVGARAVLASLREVVRAEGVRGLARGIGPRVLFHVPAAAICWGTYESAKAALARSDERGGG